MFPSRFQRFPRRKFRCSSSVLEVHGLLPATATAISPISVLARRRTFRIRASGICARVWQNTRPNRWKRRPIRSAVRSSEISRWSISAWPTFSKRSSVLQKSDELLNQVQEAAEARYRVGQGNQQDVLKAQLQHTKILQEIAHHHQEEGLLEAQMKQLLGRPQESPDIVTETLTVRVLPFTAAELLQRAREQNPDVRSKEASTRQQETQVELAHKNFRPDFNVQYAYQHTNGDTRDYYMATFGIRLPNRGRQKAELAEAQQNQERARRELDAESQRVLSEVQQQYVRAKTSEERLKIYSDGLVPQSDATFRSALSAYQSNRQDFESLLSSFLDVSEP